MLVANKPQMDKNARLEAKTGDRREVVSALKDIAFVLKMTSKVKAEILAGR